MVVERGAAPAPCERPATRRHSPSARAAMMRDTRRAAVCVQSVYVIIMLGGICCCMGCRWSVYMCTWPPLPRLLRRRVAVLGRMMRDGMRPNHQIYIPRLLGITEALGPMTWRLLRRRRLSLSLPLAYATRWAGVRGDRDAARRN